MLCHLGTALPHAQTHTYKKYSSKNFYQQYTFQDTLTSETKIEIYIYLNIETCSSSIYTHFISNFGKSRLTTTGLKGVCA